MKPKTLEEVIRERIIETVLFCHGERRAASKLLNISERTLGHYLRLYKQKGYEIPPAKFGRKKDSQ